MLPPAVTEKAPPTADDPSTNAALLVRLALFAPLLFILTAPLKVLFCVNVIGLLPALKLEVPETVKAPVCVIAPAAVADKLLPMLDVANVKAKLLMMDTLFV